MFTPIFKLQSFHKNKGFFFYYNQRTNKTFLIFRFCVWQYANYGNTALRQYVNTALRQYGIISAWTILIKDGVIYYTAVLPNWWITRGNYAPMYSSIKDSHSSKDFSFDSRSVHQMWHLV